MAELKENVTFKIFYHPKTLKIYGMTDAKEVPMTLPNGKKYPHVETKIYYHTLENLAIEKKGKTYKLKITKGTL